MRLLQALCGVSSPARAFHSFILRFPPSSPVLTELKGGLEVKGAFAYRKHRTLHVW